MIRLFVALELPDAIREALAGVGVDDEVWRRVPPESLHVTLAFLGSRPPEDVETITRVLAAEQGSPAPRLALADALLLPPRRARVLAVGLEDAGGVLAALQARVSAALAEAAVYRPETRPFRAHVTIARLRPRAVPPRAAGPVPAASFSAMRVTLYRSRLHPKGARYEPVSGAVLTA